MILNVYFVDVGGSPLQTPNQIDQVPIWVRRVGLMLKMTEPPLTEMDVNGS